MPVKAGSEADRQRHGRLTGLRFRKTGGRRCVIYDWSRSRALHSLPLCHRRLQKNCRLNRIPVSPLAASRQPDVCGVIDGLTYSKRHRQTPASLKRATYAAYGIDKAGRDFEIDHRVPLCLGGDDVAENLWPQFGFEHPSYYDKDRLETTVCRMVCRLGTIALREGQAIFLGDWIAGYEQVFGESPE
jgi:hypothetical protein